MNTENNTEIDNAPLDANAPSGLDTANCYTPDRTGHFFIIYRGEAALLNVEENYTEIIYLNGDTDPFYDSEFEYLEKCIPVEKAVFLV